MAAKRADTESESDDEVWPVKRRPGRPKGSCKKSKAVAERKVQTPAGKQTAEPMVKGNLVLWYHSIRWDVLCCRPITDDAFALFCAQRGRDVELPEP